MEKHTKYKYILIVTLLINALLVATHEGEFWPFSIFPMFSQAGNPWSRAVVQQVDSVNDSTIWNTKPLSEIENRVISLDSIGVDAIDFANFVSKTKNWNQKRVQALRDLLNIEERPGANWIATQVKGSLVDDDSVVVEAIPLIMVTKDTTYYNPNITFN